MDDLYLGYLLDALDPAEKAAVEAHLRAYPDEAAKLDRLRTVLRPLEADRDTIDPPPGLAVAALARVAEHIAATQRMDPAADIVTEVIPAVPVVARDDEPAAAPRPAPA